MLMPLAPAEPLRLALAMWRQEEQHCRDFAPHRPGHRSGALVEHPGLRTRATGARRLAPTGLSRAAAPRHEAFPPDAQLSSVRLTSFVRSLLTRICPLIRSLSRRLHAGRAGDGAFARRPPASSEREKRVAACLGGYQGALTRLPCLHRSAKAAAVLCPRGPGIQRQGPCVWPVGR